MHPIGKLEVMVRDETKKVPPEALFFDPLLLC